MKTKFKVEVNGNGEYLSDIMKVIANHNEGKSKIDLDTICNFLLFQKAKLPNADAGLKIVTEGDNNQTIHISENNGKSFYLSITECEMEELREEIPLPSYMKMPNIDFLG